MNLVLEICFTFRQGDNKVERHILLLLLPLCQGKNLDAQFLGVGFSSVNIFFSQHYHLGPFTTPLLFDYFNSVFLKDGRQRLYLLNHFLRGHDSTPEVSFGKKLVLQSADSRIELMRINHAGPWIAVVFAFSCQVSFQLSRTAQ